MITLRPYQFRAIDEARATSHIVPLADRFWSRIEKTDGCWNWNGSTVHNGYGQISRGGRGGKHVRAHRLAWELANGPIPDGMLVCHSCDNRRCCNPAHMFIGTPADNTRDMKMKGRGVDPPRNDPNRNAFRVNPPRGEKNYNAKLTVAEVSEIRDIYARGGSSYGALSVLFGVAKGTICSVIKGRTWR